MAINVVMLMAPALHDDDGGIRGERVRYVAGTHQQRIGTSRPRREPP
jgi:hypothetical protein